jgi:hypothetical protein
MTVVESLTKGCMKMHNESDRMIQVRFKGLRWKVDLRRLGGYLQRAQWQGYGLLYESMANDASIQDFFCKEAAIAISCTCFDQFSMVLCQA